MIDKVRRAALHVAAVEITLFYQGNKPTEAEKRAVSRAHSYFQRLLAEAQGGGLEKEKREQHKGRRDQPPNKPFV